MLVLKVLGVAAGMLVVVDLVVFASVQFVRWVRANRARAAAHAATLYGVGSIAPAGFGDRIGDWLDRSFASEESDGASGCGHGDPDADGDGD